MQTYKDGYQFLIRKTSDDRYKQIQKDYMKYSIEEVNRYMNYEIGDVYILLEDLDMCNDNYGFRTGGGTAKAGQRFELSGLPNCKKKKYTLLPLDVKFPYHLYLRENDFKRLFTKED